MKRARPDHGIVHLASLDLRARPDHRSELKSQLLLGETVRVLKRDRKDAWWWVEGTTDGYRGWARSWGLIPVGARRAGSWNRAATARVSALIGRLYERPRGLPVGPVFWNSRLVPGRRRGKWIEVRLPDGRGAWTTRGALRVLGDPIPSLRRRLRELLGIPYLWGGRTPAGFDCSGLIQQLLAEQGISLPRDADAQARSPAVLLGRAEDPEAGDLIFFGNPRTRLAHVALALADGCYLHARGAVRLNSLSASNPLYDKELADQVRATGRIRESRRGGG